MPFSWRRLKSLNFPLIYSKFNSLDSSGFKKVVYRIEDLKSDRFEEVISIMKNKHLAEEPMYSSKGIPNEPTSLQEMINNWTNMLDQGISLVCFEEGSDEIVAVNILGVVTETEFDAPHSVKNFKIIKFNII